MTDFSEQGRFDFGEVEYSKATDESYKDPENVRVVRVLPDVVAIDRVFDYLVPEAWIVDGRAENLGIGSRVRIPLGGRQVGGWVIDDYVEPLNGVRLRSLSKHNGVGPSVEVIDLARWAAWRWVGSLSTFLGTASPPTIVKKIDFPYRQIQVETCSGSLAGRANRAFKSDRTVLRIPPSGDLTPIFLEAARMGDVLALVPSIKQVKFFARELRTRGIPVSVMPNEWAQAASGGMVLGNRAAAFAPVKNLSAVLLIDEHDESYQEERSPTWNARELVIERARRANVPCVITSPSPSLEALNWGELVAPQRSEERTGWPVVDLIDRCADDPVRSGLLSDALVPILRREDRSPIVCVLNRRGRSRLLACSECGVLARCEKHHVPFVQDENRMLICSIADCRQPEICGLCGSTRFRNLRAGVNRIREELEALARRPVMEVTASEEGKSLPDFPIYVGTEAVLHRVDKASRVIFLDFDQELLAPRFRAVEHAVALLAKGARLLGVRDDGGRLVIQTRQVDHDALQAVLHADPGRLTATELERRRLLKLPPYSALVQISGKSAAEFISRLGTPSGIEILGPRKDSWLIRADSYDRLIGVLNTVERPSGRLRIEVDPLRA